MKRLYHITILITLTLILSCSEEVTLDVTHEPKLVVFGDMTNNEDFVSIRVEKTTQLKSKKPTPVNDAQISLYKEGINGRISLVTNDFQVQDGNYTSTEIVSPVIGQYYWIEVDLPDGTALRSEKELLKVPVEIKEVTVSDNKIRTSFIDPGDGVYLYMLDLSFEDQHGFGFNELKLSNNTLFHGNENAFIEMEKFSGLHVTATLANMNHGTYQFYLNVLKQIDENSSDEESGASQLFSTPPVQLSGNILNTATNRRILGNFGVIAKSNPVTKQL